MFSENSKISGRQLKRVIVLDWIGKVALLLPRFTEKADGRSFMLSLILAGSLTFVYALIIGWLSKHVEEDFYGYIKERLGVGSAWLISLVYFCYAFVNTVYLVRLFATVAVVFLLPEASQIPLMVMALVGGAYIAWGGLETGARVSEILYGIILYPLALMLFCAVFSAKPEYLAAGTPNYSLQMVKHGLQMFISFGGMGLVLFVAPNMNKPGIMSRILRKAVLLTMFSVFTLFLVSIGTFGAAGMRGLPWPAINLMSSVEIPGGFLQRWDVIFTVLLLGSFFVSIGIGFFYMRTLTENLFGRTNPVYILLFAILVLAAAAWCGNYETAARTYVIINGYILVPMMVLLTIFLALIEHIKRRRSR